MSWEAAERTSVGREILCQAILDLVEVNPAGVTNSHEASVLTLRSEYLGGAENYSTHSLLGILLERKRIQKVGSRHFHSSTNHSSI
jgi:hypothetical protein